MKILYNMPWLANSSRLLILCIIDYFIINFIFVFYQGYGIINTNVISVNLLSFCWILISYILDKYSIVEDEYNYNLINNFLRTIRISILMDIFKIIYNNNYFIQIKCWRWQVDIILI